MDKLNNFFKKLKIRAGVAALSLIVIGLLFILFPQSSANIICYVAGAFLLLWGLLCLIEFFISGARRGETNDLASGLTLACVALLLIIKPWIVADFLIVLFGIALIVDGAVKLQQFVTMNKLRMKSRWFVLVIAVLSVALGILIVFDPFSYEILMIFAGVSLIATGVMDLISLGFTRNINEKKEKNVIDLDDDDIHIENDG